MPIAMFSGVAGVYLEGTKILLVRRCHLWTEWMNDANQYIGTYSPPLAMKPIYTASTRDVRVVKVTRWSLDFSKIRRDESVGHSSAVPQHLRRYLISHDRLKS